jgi:hypothetical protein
VERIAQVAYTPVCFGVEYRPDKTCLGCPFCLKCAVLSKNLVPLSFLKFNFMPERLDQFITAPKEISGRVVEDMFRRCHWRIYKAWPKNSLGLNWKLVLENAKTSKTSLETFMAIMMTAWSVTHPKTLFPARMLTIPLAPDKVQAYAKVCRDVRGYVDTEAVGGFMGQPAENLDEDLLLSEVAFGTAILGCKFMGQTTDFVSLYEQVEQAASHYWLAIEPTYNEFILEPHLENPLRSTRMQRDLRSEVIQHVGLMKRNARIASTMFAARARVMSTAVKNVLSKWYTTPDDFTHKDVIVTDAAKFWNVLGLAVLHCECRKAVDCLPHRLWKNSEC